MSGQKGRRPNDKNGQNKLTTQNRIFHISTNGSRSSKELDFHFGKHPIGIHKRKLRDPDLPVPFFLIFFIFIFLIKFQTFTFL